MKKSFNKIDSKDPILFAQQTALSSWANKILLLHLVALSEERDSKQKSSVPNPAIAICCCS